MEVVRWCGAQIDEITHEGSFAYPIVAALLDIALATATTQPTLSKRYVHRGLHLAEEFHFHELEHHLVTLKTRLEERAESAAEAVPSSRSLGTRGNEVLRQIEQLEGELLPAAR
jgi:hypothetical protein